MYWWLSDCSTYQYGGMGCSCCIVILYWAGQAMTWHTQIPPILGPVTFSSWSTRTVLSQTTLDPTVRISSMLKQWMNPPPPLPLICLMMQYYSLTQWCQFMCVPVFNTFRSRQNGCHFADDTFKRIFLNENIKISIKISRKFVPKVPINNNPALVLIMAWRRPGDKPLSETMMVRLPTQICVTRPQWVNMWALVIPGSSTSRYVDFIQGALCPAQLCFCPTPFVLDLLWSIEHSRNHWFQFIASLTHQTKSA